MADVVFDHVSKVFPGGTTALDDMTLRVEEGEFLILVGPSGCGKTTALRLLAGLERATSGRIFLGGREIGQATPRDRDIAMVFQNYALYPHMTVYKNLAFGLKQRRVSTEEIQLRVDRMSEMLGLEDLLNRRPGQLSGGQRQRVAMGRALVREPKAFLLDEPLSNLDAKLRVQMRAELKRLHYRLGITTIYVTHDQIEAMTLGDRIAVLSAGKLQQVGAPQDVYDRPSNVFVAGFIGSPSMNLLRGRATGGRVIAGDLAFDREGVPDTDVIVGVRPESMRPAGEGDAGPGFEVAVDVVEPLGDEVLVHGTVEARDPGVRIEGEEATLLAAAPTERAPVTVRLDPQIRPAPGSSLQVALDAAAVHLFDAETGERIG